LSFFLFVSVFSVDGNAAGLSVSMPALLPGFDAVFDAVLRSVTLPGFDAVFDAVLRSVTLPGFDADIAARFRCRV